MLGANVVSASVDSSIQFVVNRLISDATMQRTTLTFLCNTYTTGIIGAFLIGPHRSLLETREYYPKKYVHTSHECMYVY